MHEVGRPGADTGAEHASSPAAGRDGAGSDQGRAGASVPSALRAGAAGAAGTPIPPAVLMQLQRAAGNRAIQRVVGGPTVQRDFLSWATANQDLAGLLSRLESEVHLLREHAAQISDHGMRLMAAIDSAHARLGRDNYSPAALLRYVDAVRAGMGPLVNSGEAYSRAASIHSQRMVTARTATQLMNQIIAHPYMRQTVTEDRAAGEQSRQEARAEAAPRRLTAELRRYIRRHWQGIRRAPTIHKVRIDEMMRDALGDQDAVDAFVQSARGDFGRFMRLLDRNPRAITENRDNIMRALALWIGGEWADIVMPESPTAAADAERAGGAAETSFERDRREAAELTGDSETSWQAEVAGIGADTATTSLPIVDQMGDVRDFSAHVFALLNLDGRRPGEVSSVMRWLGVVATAIGVIPTIGSILKGAGRIGIRLVGAGGSAIASVASRAIDPVVNLLRRVDPRITDIAERVLGRVRTAWDELASAAQAEWNRAAERVSDILDSALIRLLERGRAAAARWRDVRAAGERMVAPALNRLRSFLDPLFDGVISRLRRGGEAISEAAAPFVARIQEFRTSVANLRDRFSSADTRMADLDAQFTRLDALNVRLQDALASGDTEALQPLLEEGREVIADIERRLSPAAGADAAAQVPGTSRTRSPADGHRADGDGPPPQADEATTATETTSTETPSTETPDTPETRTTETSRAEAETPAVDAETPTVDADEVSGVVPGPALSENAAPSSDPATLLRPGDPPAQPHELAVQADTGTPVRTQREFQRIAGENGVEIDVRPANREAPRRLAEGNLPKPEAIKAKTINELDLHLGFRREDIGLVGYRMPNEPVRLPDMDDATWNEIRRRYSQRLQEYYDLGPSMTDLQRPPGSRTIDSHGFDGTITLDEHGVVRTVTEDGRTVGFTGDHDVFQIRDAETGQPVTGERYNAIIDRLRGAGIGVEHGAHMNWAFPAHQAGVFDAIVNRHTTGDNPEQLVTFSGQGSARTTAATSGEEARTAAHSAAAADQGAANYPQNDFEEADPGRLFTDEEIDEALSGMGPSEQQTSSRQPVP